MFINKLMVNNNSPVWRVRPPKLFLSLKLYVLCLIFYVYISITVLVLCLLFIQPVVGLDTMILVYAQTDPSNDIYTYIEN